jgi:arylsulfatase
VAEHDIPIITAGGMTCGADPGSRVSPDYQSPFRFTGNLHIVTVDLSGKLIDDHEGELRVAMW